MTARPTSRPVPGRTRPGTPVIMGAVCVAALVIAMALDTRVVRVGSPLDARANVFSPVAFGQTEFPKVKAYVEAHAVDAATLAAAIAKNGDAAAKQYAMPAVQGPDFPVKFTGKVGAAGFGSYDVAVPGMPPGVTISVETGPFILGTALRDATGTIKFSQFENQIQYQNAGVGLNNEMKKVVLAPIDVAKLAGKTITVVGAFELTDPTTWSVTPVGLTVQ